MARKDEIQQALVESIAEQERALYEEARRRKERLDAQIEERETAQKQYPQLVGELEAKKKLKERLEGEIAELENRVALAEISIQDDGKGSLSRIASSRRNYERAKQTADSFVAEKVRELSRSR